MGHRGVNGIDNSFEDKTQGGQTKTMYIWITLIILVVVIAGGYYFRDYFERLDPNYYTKHQEKGKQYLNKGLNDLAIGEFIKAAKAKPESIDTYYNLGIAYERQRKLDKAAETFEQALKISPGRKDIHYSLGLTYQMMEKFDLALKEYHEIARQDPGSFQVFNNVGVIQIKLGDYEKALMAIKHSIEIKPDYYQAYFSLAKVYELQGRKDLAARQYQYIKKNAANRPETANFVMLADQRLEALNSTKESSKR